MVFFFDSDCLMFPDKYGAAYLFATLGFRLLPKNMQIFVTDIKIPSRRF